MLNLIFIIMLGLFLGFTVADGYGSISQKVDELNNSIESFNAMKSSGIDGRKYQSLNSKLAKSSVNRPNDDKIDYNQITEVLKKPANAPADYLDWVKSEMSSISEYDEIIDNNARIIGNILPTFSESAVVDDDVFSKNRITLKSLVRYVEENLLKKYALESYSTVGLANIAFSTSQVGAVNIGSYKLNLEVAGSNNSLFALMDFIQNSGKLPLKDGKLVDNQTQTDTGGVLPPRSDIVSTDSTLSNLLITIDSAKFDLPPERNDDKNKAQFTLVLYVRGRSYTDFIQIRNELAANVKQLRKDIETNGALCKDGANTLCKNTSAFTAVNAIKALQDDILAIDQKLQDSLKNTTIKNISTEFDNLYNILTTYNAINTNYQKNFSDIAIVKSTT